MYSEGRLRPNITKVVGTATGEYRWQSNHEKSTGTQLKRWKKDCERLNWDFTHLFDAQGAHCCGPLDTLVWGEGAIDRQVSAAAQELRRD